MDALAGGLGAVTPDATGRAELRAFLDRFFSTYRRYGPVIRAWMEGHVDDREAARLGRDAFTGIATAFSRRLHDAGAPSDRTTIAALMAMLERSAYFLVSRRLDFETAALLDSITNVVHRGFFAAPLAA